MLTPGPIFTKKRLSLGKTLREVSQETRIQERFLSYIEDDRFDRFDSSVFISGFIKIYSNYLSLDVDKMLALYRRLAASQLSASAKTSTRKRKFSLSLTPTKIITAIIIGAILSVLAYLYIQFYNFQRPPELVISEPSNNLTTDKEKLVIKGYTETEVNIEINGTSIQTNEENRFAAEIELQKGVNTISIKATKKNNDNREKFETLTVTYKPENQNDETNEKVEETLKKDVVVLVEIKDSEAWIQLEIDGSQEIAQVIQVGKTARFKAKESIFIISGKPGNTKLIIDGKNYTLNINSETGVASLDCSVKLGEAICQN